jgi:hypothetical protein
MLQWADVFRAVANGALFKVQLKNPVFSHNPLQYP